MICFTERAASSSVSDSATPSGHGPRTRAPRTHVPLTPRERDVFHLVAGGLTIAATAAELGISPNTVKTHVKSAYAKLGVRTRAAAALAARPLGLAN